MSEALDLHKKYKGKLAVASKVPLDSRKNLGNDCLGFVASDYNPLVGSGYFDRGIGRCWNFGGALSSLESGAT